MPDENMINEGRAFNFDSLDLTNINVIQTLCQEYHIKPSRQHGQNFLINRDVVQKIIDLAKLRADDLVLEVGPGFGVITRELASRVWKVVAVEIDKKFVSLLKKSFRGSGKVEILKDDILQTNLTKLGLADLDFKVASNLPYNITSHFIRQRLTSLPRPELMALVVQKEVAERICAKPGEMSRLSVSVQFYSRPEIVAIVTRRSFWPEPEVDSALVKIDDIGKHRGLLVDKDFDDKKFFQIVHIGFSARRKMLKNNLAIGLRISDNIIEQALKGAGLDKKARAQELGVGEWIKLTGYLTLGDI